MNKRRLGLKDYLRIHIDLPSVVVIIVIAAIFYRPLLTLLFQGCTFICKQVSFPGWCKDVGLNVASEFIAAVLLVLGVYLFIRATSKPYFAGNFIAYEGDGTLPATTEWGKLKLTYNIFTKRVKGLLVSKDEKERIAIDGFMERERYLRGTYVGDSNPVQLRFGAFIMTLDANGEHYSGYFVYLSPTTGFEKTSHASAEWKRES